MCLVICLSKGFDNTGSIEIGIQIIGREGCQDLNRGITLACPN